MDQGSIPGRCNEGYFIFAEESIASLGPALSPTQWERGDKTAGS
jgi:hypothetical protein